MYLLKTWHCRAYWYPFGWSDFVYLFFIFWYNFVKFFQRSWSFCFNICNIATVSIDWQRRFCCSYWSNSVVLYSLNFFMIYLVDLLPILCWRIYLFIFGLNFLQFKYDIIFVLQLLLFYFCHYFIVDASFAPLFMCFTRYIVTANYSSKKWTNGLLLIKFFVQISDFGCSHPY